MVNKEMVLMLRGNAGYEAGDASLAGPRHRATLREGYWQSVAEDVAENLPRFASKA